MVVYRKGISLNHDHYVVEISTDHLSVWVRAYSTDNYKLSMTMHYLQAMKIMGYEENFQMIVDKLKIENGQLKMI